MSEAGRVADLEAQLRAAKKTVEALTRRAEQVDVPDDAGVFALQKAIASLETIIAQRTRAMHASEARFRALFDHSPDMIFILDEQGRVTTANETSLVALSQDFDAVVGRPFADLFDAPSRMRAQRIAQGRGAGQVPPELRFPDGRVVSVTAGPLPGFAGVMQVVLRDVTARRTLESELHHARRLAAMGHLAASVAHEINNPLAVMQLRLDLLEQTEPNLSQTMRDELAIVDAHLQRIARIVQNLQTFARPRTVHPQVVRVADLVAAAREVARVALRDVAFEQDVHPPDLSLAADRGQIEQLLANLFTNAGQALRGGGRLVVRARATSAGRVQLVVRDTGPGIPLEVLDKLFTPFVTTKDPTEGTGLGLAIAWSIAQEHRGTIRASNAAGGGARFELELPRGDEPAWDTGPTPALSRPARRLRVLVVDDEPGMLGALCNLVDESGHRAVGASDVDHALAAADEGGFDALLTDIRMPDATGFDLITALRERGDPLAMRAVLMSGLFYNPEPGWVYLQKPFGGDELLDALARVTGQPGG